ncbi:MAG: 1-(5-phosphoribosyl)-5-[(5-phosphoribosylamino)methylideneamino]imidazole-4-carboxamide isomerase [Leptospiraceae bacterium]|nr:1-(5-phosphoribosyl)-5-[(5-phosphoribosylamino)methylideneamino]imidazole-4-carboxamide isomerase [Leptospiraceae bacterium]
MIIIPAIDILDNEAVRLYKGDYSQKTVYSTKPWELVQGFNKNGAELIHLVDLNGARKADATNKDCIVRIRKEANVKIQLGGGIRDMEKLKYYESLGIDKFIIGTAAVNDPKFLDDALTFIGTDRIIISVDALDGLVRVSGWEVKTQIRYEELLTRLDTQGITQIIFTDISHDGTLSGPNLESYKHILDNFNFQLIASGGIASLKDIIDLTKINSKRPLYGIITGKAIYEGRLDLREAIDNTKK